MALNKDIDVDNICLTMILLNNHDRHLLGEAYFELDLQDDKIIQFMKGGVEINGEIEMNDNIRQEIDRRKK
jgi:hypothetical protein